MNSDIVTVCCRQSRHDNSLPVRCWSMSVNANASASSTMYGQPNNISASIKHNLSIRMEKNKSRNTKKWTVQPNLCWLYPLAQYHRAPSELQNGHRQDRICFCPENYLVTQPQGHWARSAHWAKSSKSFNQKLGPWCEKSERAQSPKRQTEASQYTWTSGVYFTSYFYSEHLCKVAPHWYE